MNDKNSKKHRMIKKARKRRFIWTLGTFLLIFSLYFFLIKFSGYLSVELFLILFFLLFFVSFLIIWYYLYIQFFAQLYRCKYCNTRFYIGFWKFILKDFFIHSRYESIIFLVYRINTKEEDKINSPSYWEFKIKCPCCKEKLWRSESVDKVTR